MSATSETATELLARNYRVAHKRLLAVVEELTDEQFGRSVHPALHSIAWHVWHVARWDDRLAEILLEKLPDLARTHGSARQIWTSEALSARWGLPVGSMGLRDTGTSMEDEAAEHLSLPRKSEVVDYARRVFAFVDALTGSLGDETLLAVLPGDPDGETTGQNVMHYIAHGDRHLGMIEAMKGQLGLVGTATR